MKKRRCTKLGVESLERRDLMAGLIDSAGEIGIANEPMMGYATEAVQHAKPWIDITIQITTPDGKPLDELKVGQDFVLHARVQDLRANGRGVFSAYMDLLWDREIAIVTGPLVFGANYPEVQ